MAEVALVLALLAGHDDLLGIHDHHEVAHIAVRRVLRLALATEGVGDARREPAERLPAGVDDEPFALARSWCGHKGLHLEAASEVSGHGWHRQGRTRARS